MKVLFLDIDGVVNCEKTFQKFSHRGIIGIDPYMAFMVGKIKLDTDCDVVLSSSWRYGGKKLLDEVRKQVVDFIGVTPDVEHNMIRGNEIKAWLDKHPKVKRYAILDDDSDVLPEQKSNFFQTSWKTGITEDIARQVTDHLNKKS